MANLPISLLPELTAITLHSEFAVVESGTTYKVKSVNLSSGRPYASFYSTEDQFITGTTQQSYIMSADTVAYSQGIDVVDGSKFTVTDSGLYNLTFSSQFNRLSGTEGSIITIWLRVNGVDEVYSAGEISAGIGDFNSRQLPSWNFMVYLNSGDYAELVWSSTNQNTFIHAVTPQTLPDRPGIPSVAVTLTQI